MWLYILIIITIPIYALLIKDKKKFVILVAIQLFLILALRDITMGTDLGNYYGGYNYIGKLDFGGLISSLRPSGVSDLMWMYEYENGYTVFNWLTSHVGIDFHGFLVICAAINISSVSYFIYKYSKKPWLSFVIFCALGFYTGMFGLLRHSLALSMCLLSYCFLDKKRYVFAILAFLLAFSFHRTVIIALPLLALLIVPIKNITRKRFLYLLLFSVLIFILAAPIYNNIISSVMVLMEKNYAGSEDIELNKKIFIFVTFAILMLLTYNFSKIKTKMENISCYGLLFAIYFTIIGFYNAHLTRALPFYSVFLLLLVPDLFEQYKGQRSIVIFETVTVVLLAIYAYSITAGSTIDPYVVYHGVLS